MRRTAFRAVLLLGLLATPAGAGEPTKVTAAAVLAEVESMLDLPLWPGFEPRRIPQAVFDGERTILVRHPSPPPEFKREGDLWVYPGQHALMRANTSVELGGVTTATVLVRPESSSGAREWASTLMHETFHVFQRQRHPKWQGDEGELFLYPVDAPEPLAARRLETEALRRALAAGDLKLAACWTGRALEMRRKRFEALPAGSVAYERGSELNEGLATFVGDLALKKRASGPDLPASDYPAGDVRLRSYAVGHALAALLERFDPAWRETLEKGGAASLDELLAKGIAGKETVPCGFSAEESAGAQERARADTQNLARERADLRAAFLGRSGWRIEITSPRPLWPQRFDPWNVKPLTGGEVLHGRWLKTGNDSSEVEILDRESLTEAAGAHPLFNGFRKLTVTGLSREPGVRQEGDFLVIEGEGVKAKLKGKAEKEGSVLRVKLP